MDLIWVGRSAIGRLFSVEEGAHFADGLRLTTKLPQGAGAASQAALLPLHSKDLRYFRHLFALTVSCFFVPDALTRTHVRAANSARTSRAVQLVSRSPSTPNRAGRPVANTRVAAAVAHSVLMLAALIIGHHFSISAL
jgi:hypothetical protein